VLEGPVVPEVPVVPVVPVVPRPELRVEPLVPLVPPPSVEEVPVPLLVPLLVAPLVPLLGPPEEDAGADDPVGVAELDVVPRPIPEVDPVVAEVDVPEVAPVMPEADPVVPSLGEAACCRRWAFSPALSESSPQCWRSSTRVSSRTERTSLIRLVRRSWVSLTWVWMSESRKYLEP
jgi:hypothetical protein